jgi:hypothetical protein
MAQIINAVSSFIKNIAIHADTVAVAQIAEQGGRQRVANRQFVVVICQQLSRVRG